MRIQRMASCDAKYKVYLHQDTFILYQNFLKDTINIFENNSTIGMIGVLGTTKLPENANCYLSWNIGKVAAYDGISLNSTDFLYQTNALPYISVEAIDGMLMMTQYDLPWREDTVSLNCQSSGRCRKCHNFCPDRACCGCCSPKGWIRHLIIVLHQYIIFLNSNRSLH